VTKARNIAMLVSPATTEFCRRARRLRHVYRNDPVRMHRSLRELRPATRVAARRVEPTDFAAMVAARLEGPVLPYSRRQELLRIAGRVGIGRFEANLIIASVQHRAAETRGKRIPGPLKRPLKRTLRVHATQRIALFGAFLLIQSAIVLAIWSLLVS
jgi:hypothetical protein